VRARWRPSSARDEKYGRSVGVSKKKKRRRKREQIREGGDEPP